MYKCQTQDFPVFTVQVDIRATHDTSLRRPVVPEESNSLREDVLVLVPCCKGLPIKGDHLLGTDGVQIVNTNVL